MAPMIVMKFGGTSVGDAERIRGVSRLVREALDRGPIVVVSALGGVTDLLLTALAAAETRDDAALAACLASLRERHERVVQALQFPPALRALALQVIDAELAPAGDTLRGVFLLGERTPRTADRVAAVGEILSHRIVALALRAEDLAAEAIDPRELVPTDARHGAADPDRAELRRRAHARLLPLVRDGIVPVTGGFVGATADGLTTTLGRGGSDFTASLLGAAVGAEEVQIWTDVPGMMSADPRVVPQARTLPRVSFAEAAELAYFGAKVLHPATIRPCVESSIPVRILDATQPGRGGTTVDAGGEPWVDAMGEPGSASCVRAVAWKRGITTIAMDSPRMLGAHGFLARVFAVFERHETPVDVVTTSEVSVSVTVDRPQRIDAIERELASFCDVRVHAERALVCLVGRGLLESPQLVGQVLAAVHPTHLRMFCLGSSDINLTLVVDEADAESVVQRLHARFLEDA